MKRLLLIPLGVALAGLAMLGQSQSVITSQTSTVTNYSMVTFTGNDAKTVAMQLLSVTNASGSVIAPASLTNRTSFTVGIHIVNSNGVPQSITAVIR